MTRDRTISAVFMAVVLILASGTAVSLAVTGSSTSDVGTNAVAAQEETTTAANETTVAQERPASITFNDQRSGGATVVIESVTMEEGGFIAIHDSSVQEAPIASVLGNSVYLEPGTHENVTVTLARPIDESQTLIAMPHRDTNNNRVYDFVLSTGEIDGPYTDGGGAITDAAEITLVEETTTPAEEETTTPEEAETTTPEEEEEVEETTTPEEEVEETTTPEEEEVETTPEEEEEEVETTPEEEEEEEVVEEPAEQQRLIFKIEQMQIDEWSFVIGDEEEPDRTKVISDVTVQDRRVVINLTEILQQQEQMAAEQMTTPEPEEAAEQLEDNLTGDIPTVRFVIRNVNIENVTFVIIAPADMELPEPPAEVETTTPEEEEEVVETTPEEEVETTTPEEEEEVETTTPEEEVVETTTPEEEEEVEETTTPEEEEEVETTTPEEEEEVEETTTPEEVETTTPAEEEEVQLDSFEVSNLDAPESAVVGDNITVSATITNPNDQQATQDVAFRLDGTVLERKSVTLDANEQTTVTFEIDTSGLPAGQYIHGVYTRGFGELAVIVLEEPTQETTTPAEEETTTPAEEETTTAVETTTEEA